MTQHTPSPTDQQHPTRHPLDETGTPLDQDARPGPSGWWYGLLALPIACCGLPLLIAAGVSTGSGAVLGGITGGVLMLAGAAVLAIWGTRAAHAAPAPPDTLDAHVTGHVLLRAPTRMNPHSSTQEQQP